MEITLREARKLDTRIGQALKELKVSSTASLNAYEDVATVPDRIEEAQAKFKENLEAFVELETIRTNLRRGIQSTNEKSGINTKISDRHHVIRLIERYQVIANATRNDDNPSIEAIQAEVEANRVRDTTWSDNSRVSVGILTTNDRQELNEAVNNMRRQIDAIETELAALNVNTKITIAKDTVDILKKNNVVL